MNNQITLASILIAAILGGVVAAAAITAFQPAAPTAPAPAPTTAPEAGSLADQSLTPDPRLDDLLERVTRLEQLAAAPDGSTGLRDEVADLRHQIDELNADPAASSVAPDAAVDSTSASAGESAGFDNAVRNAVENEMERRAEVERQNKEEAKLQRGEEERKKRRAWLDRNRDQMVDRIDKIVTLHPAQRDAISQMLTERTNEYEALITRAGEAKQAGETDWTWWEDGQRDLEERTMSGIRSQLDATQLQQLDGEIGDRGLDALSGDK